MWHHRVDFPFSFLSMNMKQVITLHVIEWSNSSMSQNTPVKTQDCMLFVFRCIHAQCANPSSFLVILEHNNARISGFSLEEEMLENANQ
jgi:hypothetical protein